MTFTQAAIIAMMGAALVRVSARYPEPFSLNRVFVEVCIFALFYIGWRVEAGLRRK